ncbi:MAG: DUF4339 domain-containing protein [Planctomycetaceae bacterium]|nr:DUF4339 domain-containing protein [Planctomycetaceae bacterium]
MNSGKSTTDDLEVADSIDDLNLNFVSGSAPVKSRQEQDLPSIDEFVLEKPTQQEHKPLHEDAWYARILGQELGPFPFDEIVGMVAAGEIGPQDQLRNGNDASWISTLEIEGLLPEQATDDDDDFELDGEVQLSETDEKHASSHVRVVGGEINNVIRESRLAAEHNRAVSAEEPVEVPEPQPELTPEEIEQQRKQEIADRLNAWLDTKVNPPVQAEIPAVEAAASVSPPLQTPPAVVKPQSVAPQQPVETSQYSPPEVPSWEPQAPPTQAAVKPVTAPKPQIRKGSGESLFSRLGGMFGGISAPSASVKPLHLAILGGVILVGALIYGASFIGGIDDEKVLARFQEIYNEIKQKRASNPAAIAEMQNSVVPELEVTVQELLDAGAGSKKPVLQQLMWIGKNCLIPMIKSPSSDADQYDERLETHLEAIQALKNSSNNDASTTTSNADP